MFYKFTPDLMSKEDLEYISTGREKTVANIVKKLQNSISSNLATHILLVGQRGIGKTHTLLQIYHKLNEFSNFTTIRLSEEEYSVTSVENLFKRILEELNVEFDENNVEATALNEFNNLKNQKKFPVIFVDNLQMLFEQMENELPKLRAILQEHNPFCIVGSALTVFHEISSHDEPFYNFMDVTFLKGLNVKAMRTLIKKRFECGGKKELLKNFEKYTERVKGIHILTCGNPRLTHALCEILLQKNSLVDLESNLLELLDQLTPYYQVRMEQLSITQRKIVDTLSQEKGPISPTELAQITKMKVASVVTQLRRLENNGIAEAIKFRDKKETSYQVTERLYRIWREMRSPIGSKRISLFINFLKIWYTRKERLFEYRQLSDRFFEISTHSEEDTKKHLVYACYLLDTMPDMKILDLENTVQRFMLIGDFDSALREIKSVEEFKKQMSNKIISLAAELSMAHARCCMSEASEKYGHLRDAVKERDLVENKLMRITKKYQNKSDSKEHAWLHQMYHKLASHYIQKNELDKAEKYVDLSMAVINYSCTSSMLEKSIIMIHRKDFKKALKVLSEIPKALSEIPKALSEIPKDKIGREVNVLRLGCLVEINKVQDAEKIAIDLINSGFEDFFRILDAVGGTNDLGLLSKVVDVTFGNLSNLDEKLQKELVPKIAGDIAHYAAHTMAENENKFTEMLFDSLETLARRYTIDAYFISLLPVTELVKDDKLEKAVLFMDKIIEIDSFSEESVLPLNRALNYIKTENPDILEKVHKEYRDLITNMILEISPTTKIPQQIIDSLQQ